MELASSLDSLSSGSGEFDDGCSVDKKANARIRRSRKRTSETDESPTNKKLKSALATYRHCRDDESRLTCVSDSVLNGTNVMLEEQNGDCGDLNWEVIDSWQDDSFVENGSLQGLSRTFEVQRQMSASDGLDQEAKCSTQKCGSCTACATASLELPLDRPSEGVELVCSEESKSSNLLCYSNEQSQSVSSKGLPHVSFRTNKIKLKKMKLVLSKVDRRKYEPQPFLQVRIARSQVRIPHSLVGVQKEPLPFLQVRIPRCSVRIPSSIRVSGQKDSIASSSLVDSCFSDQQVNCSVSDVALSDTEEHSTATSQCCCRSSPLESETRGWNNAGKRPLQLQQHCI